MTAPVTTPAREQEASATDVAFYTALTAIGVETIEDALALWQDVPVGATAEVAATWLSRAVALVMARRGMSRDLAIAYYRLARALRTGRTIPDPRDPIPTQVTLQQLRFEFEQLVDSAGVAPETPADAGEQAPGSTDIPEPISTPQAGADGTADSDPPRPAPDEPEVDLDTDVIPIEDIDVDLDELEDDLAEQAEEQARDLLANLGPIQQHKKAAALDTSKPADDVDKQREEINRDAGIRQASAAEHTVLNGGRGTVYALAANDRRVIGWVRYSKTGTPCGFCAMLISRGPTLKDGSGKVVRMGQLYSSEDVAAPEAEVDKYHLNCKCAAFPVYSVIQFWNDAKYDLNREYAELWPKVTKGLSGPDAFRAWRNFIEAKKRDEEPSPTKANAQAA